MRTIFLLALLMPTYSFAFGETLPKCDSFLVRVSKEPIPCVGKAPENVKWDLPTHSLNVKELEKLFQGAVSSGGRLVGPMNVPQVAADVTSFPFNLSCDMRLLSDGNKKVSFLSFTRFNVNESYFNHLISPFSWRHTIIAGNDIDATNYVSVPVAPAVEIPTYEYRVKYSEQKKEFTMELCSLQMGSNGDSSHTCGMTKVDLSKEAFDIYLKHGHISNNFRAELTAKASCRFY